MSRRIRTRDSKASFITFTGGTEEDVEFLTHCTDWLFGEVHVDSRWAGLRSPLKQVGPASYVMQNPLARRFGIGPNGEYRLSYTNPATAHYVHKMLEQLGFTIISESHPVDWRPAELAPGVQHTYQVTYNGRSFTFDLSTPNN